MVALTAFFRTTRSPELARAQSSSICSRSNSRFRRTGLTEGGTGRGTWCALRDIQANDGRRGLYRCLSPNIPGNVRSWDLYFLFYNRLKCRATVDAPPLSASQYQLSSAEMP
ncbi:hypothetical protein H4582DRAFT_1946761 [Lactarius indigo]|nr:hypothetical protein H4582DRAFT_1946761 [Lactarius indigo]